MLYTIHRAIPYSYLLSRLLLINVYTTVGCRLHVITGSRKGPIVILVLNSPSTRSHCERAESPTRMIVTCIPTSNKINARESTHRQSIIQSQYDRWKQLIDPALSLWGSTNPTSSIINTQSPEQREIKRQGRTSFATKRDPKSGTTGI